MKRKKTSLLVIVFLMVMVLVAACGQNTTPTPQKPGEPAAPPEPAEKTLLSMGTGGTGGVYYVIGGGISSIISKYVPNVEVTAETTAAGAENARLLGSGQVDMILLDPATANKLKDEEPEMMSKFRVIYSGHGMSMKLMAMANSDIISVEDFKGKRVSVGAPGSGNETVAKAIIEMHGMTYDDIKPEWLSFTETATALQDGTVDVGTTVAGDPTSAVVELATTHDIRLIELDKDLVNKEIGRFPGVSIQTIPPNTYRGQGDKEVFTVGITTHWIVRDDMDEELVYEMVKAVHQHWQELKAIHPEGSKWNGEPEFLFRGIVWDFHPGAIRYWKEAGIWDKRPAGIN
jgi:TRAP transporter TAXI family solute receptor